MRTKEALGGILGILFILSIIIGFNSFVIIDPGERGIIISRASGTNTESIMDEGFNLKIPFVQWVKEINVQKQKFTTNADASSSDLQDVQTDITLNYKLDSEKVGFLYKEIGMDFEDKVILPISHEIVKAVMAQYTAENLIKKRVEVRSIMSEMFTERLAVNYIVFMDLSITNFTFSKMYDNAIEEKQRAEQKALEEEQNKKRMIIEAEGQQRRREILADTELYEAKRKAEANDVLSRSITDKILAFKALTKWNGIVPRVITSSSVIPFINVDGSMTKK